MDPYFRPYLRPHLWGKRQILFYDSEVEAMKPSPTLL